MQMLRLLGVVVALLLLEECHADTPANCTYQDVVGKWTFYESSRNFNSSLDCSAVGIVSRKLKVVLRYPDIATDEFGNLGRWTMVYNEGFEVTVNERTFFAYSYYKQNGTNVTSICDKTLPSWSHDVTVRQWACFYGRKHTATPHKFHQDPFLTNIQEDELTEEKHLSLVETINSEQRLWRAELHRPFLNLGHDELLRIRGGRRSWLGHRPEPAPTNVALKGVAESLPAQFDWRNVEGIDYVSPVRNQGTCGSCYAFSSMGMLESRLRVQTNNTVKLELSPQDIISCSKLSQGCEGGFPYLIAGKYGLEFGTVVERCNPYVGVDGACSRELCTRHYTARYQYVGGYYGGCNEHEMQLALVRGGPLSVSFEVHSDFYNYKSGVYHHIEVQEFNPFVVVNHAVLLVGYGVDPSTGSKYWIIKNSWGKDWGENGYFRIRRGANEVGIESIAVQATPIP